MEGKTPGPLLSSSLTCFPSSALRLTRDTGNSSPCPQPEVGGTESAVSRSRCTPSPAPGTGGPASQGLSSCHPGSDWIPHPPHPSHLSGTLLTPHEAAVFGGLGETLSQLLLHPGTFQGLNGVAAQRWPSVLGGTPGSLSRVPG